MSRRGAALVDRHRLRPGVRQPGAAPRPDIGPGWTKTRLPHRPDRLRRGLGIRWPRARLRRTRERACTAGRVRGAARARGVVPADHRLPRRAQPGSRLRGLRHPRHVRLRHRDAARRGANRVPRLALVPVRQRGHGSGSLPRWHRRAPGLVVRGTSTSRRARCRHGRGGPVLRGLRLRQRRVPQLGSTPGRRVPDRRCRAARRVRAHPASGPRAAATAAGGTRPLPWRVVPGLLRGAHRLVLGRPVPHLRAAATARPHSRDDPASVPGRSWWWAW